jgi:hypothetical protein
MEEIILYKDANGKVKVEVLVQNETLWLTQAKIAVLFGVDRTVITKHLKNIFDTKELEQDSVCAKIAHTADDGKTYQTNFYNLDAIISVGYRVNSSQATAFRIWATERLKEYIIKGFTMDDERLKNPNNIFGKDYFDEQLERIRDIRSSERRFYQKITDIYAQCSADYDANDETTQQFFAAVQNKLHWAITGQTAAEIIYNTVDSSKENMGLTTWKNAPAGAIRKTDVTVAKNYLNEEHIAELNKIVSAYLDLAELNANRKQLMYMKDWVKFLGNFLELSNFPILTDKGKITMLQAKIKAEGEFEKYKTIQDKVYESDFDKLIKLNQRIK